MTDKKVPDGAAAAAVVGGVFGACIYFAVIGSLYWLFSGDFFWPWDIYADLRSHFEASWNKTDESFFARLFVGIILLHAIMLLGCIGKGAENAVEALREREDEKQE